MEPKGRNRKRSPHRRPPHEKKLVQVRCLPGGPRDAVLHLQRKHYNPGNGYGSGVLTKVLQRTNVDHNIKMNECGIHCGIL